MHGSIRELVEVLTDLGAQGTRCSWIDPATDVVCGEPASHFDSELVDSEAWVMRYDYRCLKHAQHDTVIIDEVSRYCDESIEWEEAIADVRKARAKEEVIAILESRKRVIDLLYRAYAEYAQRLLELDGPGTVEEVDQLYRDTVEKAQRSIPPRPPPKLGEW